MTANTTKSTDFFLDQLKDVKIHVDHLKDVILCMCNTILFTRTFGKVKPEDLCVDFLSQYYVGIKDDLINGELNKKIDKLVAGWKETQYKDATRVICISFYDKRQQTQWYFYSAEEEYIWEKWNLVINVDTNPSNESNKEIIREKLNALMISVVENANSQKEHIPIIPNKNLTLPFKYEIDFLETSKGNTSNFLGLKWSNPLS